MCICKGERHVVREQHGEFSHAHHISHLTIISLSIPPFCEIWKNCRKTKSSCVPAQCDVVKTAGNMKIHQCLETIEPGTQMRTNLLAAGEVVVSEVVLSGSRRLRDDIRHKCVQLSSGLNPAIVLHSVCVWRNEEATHRIRTHWDGRKGGLLYRTSKRT